MITKLNLYFACVLISAGSLYSEAQSLRPKDAVELKSVNSDIFVEAAYFSNWNFIGKPIDGYKANQCYLSAKAAYALGEVQKEVSKRGYSILVFDCYRPQRAVDQFVKWTQDATDTKMQSAFYPDEPKSELVHRGYIDAKSGHSRMSTVDLTLVRTDKFKAKDFIAKARQVKDCRQSKDVETTGQLDMGTTFDCFSELAHTANPAISDKAKKNREILKSAMEKQGFSNYPKEWWHFTLKDEPYKNNYFDFIVE